MINSPKAGPAPTPIPDWSQRLFILGIAGILFLTLFPFGFIFHSKLPGNASPFLLQSGLKRVGAIDDFLNILLFVPFGFGLADLLRQRSKSRRTTLLICLAAGALFSYGIEFLQNYIPSRDAGWHDVITNTTGSVAGFVLFELLGKPALRVLSAIESALRALLIPRRAAWIVPLYLALWFAASVHLQKETQPSNWDPNSFLVVGNAAAARPPSGWRGQVDRLEFWNHAIPDDLAKRLTAGDTTLMNSSGSIASYQFSGVPPFRDEKGFLPDLDWKSNVPAVSDSKSIVLDGKSWLTSAVPVPQLVKAIEATRQFSVHLICAPDYVGTVDNRIVTLSRASGLIDLDLRQDETNLVLWFRNPISMRRSILAWYIPNAFLPHHRRDILFSYDGANLFLYVDGQKENRKYELGPGTRLAQMLRKVKPSELFAYKYVYYFLVFFSGGILLGITRRKLDMRRFANSLLFGVALLLPPLLLETILVHVSGRARSIGDIVLAALLAVGGCLWINADQTETNGRKGNQWG